MRRNHIIILTIILALGFTGIIGYSIFTAISRSGKEAVKVYILPGDAQVTVNGQRVSAGTAYLTPGKYEIEGKKSGFADYNDSVLIESPNIEIIDIGLVPISDEAKKWAKDNERLYAEREGRGAEQARKRGEVFKQINPITNKLPINNVLYSIGYTLDPDDPTEKSIILQVDVPQGYREGVLNKIRELGYDPTNFKINFKIYESPFDK